MYRPYKSLVFGPHQSTAHYYYLLVVFSAQSSVIARPLTSIYLCGPATRDLILALPARLRACSLACSLARYRLDTFCNRGCRDNVQSCLFYAPWKPLCVCCVCVCVYVVYESIQLYAMELVLNILLKIVQLYSLEVLRSQSIHIQFDSKSLDIWCSLNSCTYLRDRTIWYCKTEKWFEDCLYLLTVGVYE